MVKQINRPTFMEEKTQTKVPGWYAFLNRFDIVYKQAYSRLFGSLNNS